MVYVRSSRPVQIWTEDPSENLPEDLVQLS